MYIWLLNAGSISGFIAWVGIAISHYRFRKAYLLQGKDPRALPYLAKGYPYVPLTVFALCIFIIAAQNYAALISDHVNWYEVLISYIGVPLFLMVWLGHKWINKTKMVNLRQCTFDLDE